MGATTAALANAEKEFEKEMKEKNGEEEKVEEDGRREKIKMMLMMSMKKIQKRNLP